MPPLSSNLIVANKKKKYKSCDGASVAYALEYEKAGDVCANRI